MGTAEGLHVCSTAVQVVATDCAHCSMSTYSHFGAASTYMCCNFSSARNLCVCSAALSYKVNQLSYGLLRKPYLRRYIPKWLPAVAHLASPCECTSPRVHLSVLCEPGILWCTSPRVNSRLPHLAKRPARTRECYSHEQS